MPNQKRQALHGFRLQFVSFRATWPTFIITHVSDVTNSGQTGGELPRGAAGEGRKTV